MLIDPWSIGRNFCDYGKPTGFYLNFRFSSPVTIPYHDLPAPFRHF
jgi:hypothetical protein